MVPDPKYKRRLQVSTSIEAHFVLCLQNRCYVIPTKKIFVFVRCVKIGCVFQKERRLKVHGKDRKWWFRSMVGGMSTFSRCSPNQQKFQISEFNTFFNSSSAVSLLIDHMIRIDSCSWWRIIANNFDFRISSQFFAFKISSAPCSHPTYAFDLQPKYNFHIPLIHRWFVAVMVWPDLLYVIRTVK